MYLLLIKKTGDCSASQLVMSMSRFVGGKLPKTLLGPENTASERNVRHFSDQNERWNAMVPILLTILQDRISKVQRLNVFLRWNLFLLENTNQFRVLLQVCKWKVLLHPKVKVGQSVSRSVGQSVSRSVGQSVSHWQKSLEKASKKHTAALPTVPSLDGIQKAYFQNPPVHGTFRKGFFLWKKYVWSLAVIQWRLILFWHRPTKIIKDLNPCQ